ncbi:MAG TPA: CDP-glycerol glycerophosphotransferase family protein [Pseudogracilibacillus sp.]|nr:CDP-glycerol glycerophosphotransferase family protein [Pseudogracilibacillus sp.]
MKKIISVIFKVLNIFNNMLYKRTDRIVLYSNLGFRDNVKAIYDYLIENKYNNKYKIICSINDRKDYKNVSIKNVKFVNNYLGLFYFLTSKYFMYSFGKYPIKPSKKQEVINLWHGSPLKTIGNLEDDKKNIDYNFFTKILATSDFFADVMKEAFGGDDSQTLICGQPRNDYLFKENYNKMKFKKNLIVWLPTFRSHHLEKNNEQQSRTIPFFNNESKMQELNDVLEKYNTELLIKLHLRQKETVNSGDYSNIKLYTDEDFKQQGLKLYEVLSYSDGLITDYSSVYFDYLLLNKPIGFIIDDIDTYAKERGFVFDKPQDYMPGPKIINTKEFYKFLKNVVDNNDNYELERNKINNLANYYTDGKNSERLLKMIGIT